MRKKRKRAVNQRILGELILNDTTALVSLMQELWDHPHPHDFPVSEVGGNCPGIN